MKTHVFTGQRRYMALYGTTGNAKVHNGSFAHKFISGKDHGAAKR